MKNNLNLTDADRPPTQKSGRGRTDSLCLGHIPVFVFAALSAPLWRIRHSGLNWPRKTFGFQGEPSGTHRNQMHMFPLRLHPWLSIKPPIVAVFPLNLSIRQSNPAVAPPSPKPCKNAHFPSGTDPNQARNFSPGGTSHCCRSSAELPYRLCHLPSQTPSLFNPRKCLSIKGPKTSTNNNQVQTIAHSTRAESPQCYSPACRAGFRQRGFLPVCRTGTNSIKMKPPTWSSLRTALRALTSGVFHRPRHYLAQPSGLGSRPELTRGL
jgi:hypothetical protein